MSESLSQPRLRPVEVFPGEYQGQQVIIVHDPAGHTTGPLTVSPAGLFVFSLMDGRHSPAQICEAFGRQFSSPLEEAQLRGMIEELDAAFFLDSPRFAAHLESQRRAYVEAPVRISADEESLGADEDGLTATLQRLLDRDGRIAPKNRSGRLVGLIAPHLDFARGRPCYGDVYSLLREQPPPRRCVVLGTNHFGQAGSVVATRKDFQTPLGTTKTDAPFIERLSSLCQSDLCRHEFDHRREHSVELQVLMLQKVLGPDNFELVPILCPDPCGPMGTAPVDGEGVDLDVFVSALRELTQEEPDRTLIIAGADLSHVGPRFGDERPLDEEYLREVELMDQTALEPLVAGQPRRFLETLVSHDNHTHVCSAGCIYTLSATLNGARGELLRYHQAVDVPNGTCVTCASMAFWE